MRIPLWSGMGLLAKNGLNEDGNVHLGNPFSGSSTYIHIHKAVTFEEKLTNYRWDCPREVLIMYNSVSTPPRMSKAVDGWKTRMIAKIFHCRFSDEKIS